MYTWQTLTLARLEAYPGVSFTPAQHAAARDLLLTIGLRDFPIPTVTAGTRTVGEFRRAVITWKVDEREWVVAIESDGVCMEHYGAGTERKSAQLPLRTDGIRLRTITVMRRQWLLFGDREGADETVEAPTKR